ncbi:MAG: 1-acyl-sn-glycerol-3-phosphate acyltransferase, partial [uncultured Thermoleophilia bacterium]
ERGRRAPSDRRPERTGPELAARPARRADLVRPPVRAAGLGSGPGTRDRRLRPRDQPHRRARPDPGRDGIPPHGRLHGQARALRRARAPTRDRGVRSVLGPPGQLRPRCHPPGPRPVARRALPRDLRRGHAAADAGDRQREAGGRDARAGRGRARRGRLSAGVPPAARRAWSRAARGCTARGVRPAARPEPASTQRARLSRRRRRDRGRAAQSAILHHLRAARRQPRGRRPAGRSPRPVRRGPRWQTV